MNQYLSHQSKIYYCYVILSTKTMNQKNLDNLTPQWNKVVHYLLSHTTKSYSLTILCCTHTHTHTHTHTQTQREKYFIVMNQLVCHLPTPIINYHVQEKKKIGEQGYFNTPIHSSRILLTFYSVAHARKYFIIIIYYLNWTLLQNQLLT